MHTAFFNMKSLQVIISFLPVERNNSSDHLLHFHFHVLCFKQIVSNTEWHINTYNPTFFLYNHRDGEKDLFKVIYNSQ